MGFEVRAEFGTGKTRHPNKQQHEHLMQACGKKDSTGLWSDSNAPRFKIQYKALPNRDHKGVILVFIQAAAFTGVRSKVKH